MEKRSINGIRDNKKNATINREQKCHGGIKGYSTTVGTVQRWVLTSHSVSKCISNLNSDLKFQKKSVKPKDLGKSRNDFNHDKVDRAIEVISNWGNPFKKRDCLINICSGVKAPPELADDIIQAEDIGLTSLREFIDKRIVNSEVSFYDPIKKNKLRTFAYLFKKKSIKLQDKTITLTAERAIFARMLVIAKIQEGMSLKLLMTYSLTPIPLVFGLPDGSLVKTVKSKLLGTFTFYNVINVIVLDI